MLATSVIAKKRDGQELHRQELEFLMNGYVQGQIPDYQVAAWAMAVYLRGMSPKEVQDLTEVMIQTGSTLSGGSKHLRVDKHSTGGLGDKTSLILAPLLAECGLHVPMISGRGLGITGGTLDKLESIPGFRTDLSEKEIEDQLERVGCVITGASANLVPADRKLYALRDVTATVPSIPLITASIMSKKLAESLHALVLDVKWGSGAFMKDKKSALALADSLIQIGERFGVPTSALLSDMNQPLGEAVGNAIEVNESIDILQGACKNKAYELSVELAIELLLQTNICSDRSVARRLIEEKIVSGAAWDRFQRMVHLQGGGLHDHLPLARPFILYSTQEGFVQKIDGQSLGEAMIVLGGGRKVATDRIDPAVGFSMKCRIGSYCERGQPLMEVHARSEADYQSVEDSLRGAFHIAEGKSEPFPLWEKVERS